jgi:hypothetical protein
MNLRKVVSAVVVMATMVGSQGLAADGLLLPGKPAGVQQAQRSPNLFLIGAGATIALVGLAVALSSGGDATCDAAHCPPNVATSTTS